EGGAREQFDRCGEAERERGRNLAREGFRVERVEAESLHADERVGEVNHAVYLPRLVRLDGHAPVALLYEDALAHAQRSTCGGLLDDTRAQDHRGEVVRGAVHYRQLKVINFDV